MFEKKIEELTGEALPVSPKPLASYIPGIQSGNLVFTSGQIPLKEGKLMAEGKVGSDVSEEMAINCARQCLINCLAVVKSIVGDLDKVDQILKITVFVASAPGYTAQPKVANGASDLVVEIFGDKGKHARSAVGVAELPINAPVEIEMMVRVNI